jgi:AcrR family transcriptional regulator
LYKKYSSKEKKDLFGFRMMLSIYLCNGESIETVLTSPSNPIKDIMASKHKPKKRELILTTALKLFNKQGSHRVTTNHISKAMSISPGNLYYHFKNKEHIIRELLVRLIEAFDSITRVNSEVKSGLDLIADAIEATGDLIYTYQFIYKELAALLTRDEMFKKMYCDIKEKRAQEFALLFEFIAQMDVLRRAVTPEERDAIIFILWTYTEGIVTALHTSDIPVTRTSIHTQFKKIIYIFKDYLRSNIWSELIQKLDLEKKA